MAAGPVQIVHPGTWVLAGARVLVGMNWLAIAKYTRFAGAAVVINLISTVDIVA